MLLVTQHNEKPFVNKTTRDENNNRKIQKEERHKENRK